MNSRYFSEERVNTGRQPEIDLLKALCVIGMIFTHVLLDLRNDALPGEFDAYVTHFFGANTFMICMGIGMCYTRDQSPRGYFIRGFALLTIGQFLNIVRNAIPNLIAYWLVGGQFFIANSFLVLQSDILSFAGLAFFLMGLLKKLDLKAGHILAIGVLLNLIALILWHGMESPDNYFVSQLLAYFVITDAEAYFPLLCYFIFPALGYFIGSYYPHIKDKDGLANRVMLICFPLTVVYYFFRFTREWSYLPEVGGDLQYNMQPTPDAIFISIFTLGFIALLYKIVKAAGGRLPKVIMHFSANINSYYCIHYMFVLPLQTILIAVTGELMDGVLVPFLYGCLVTFLCYWIITLNDKYWHIHFTTLKGTGRIVFVAAVWIATIAIAAYAYPRIDEFANIWNEYLIP